MKRFSRIFSVIMLVAVTLTLFVSADNEYSSKDDPLVSLSYVNDVLTPEIVTAVMNKIEKEYVKISDLSSVAAGKYAEVSLKKGQTLMAGSCCELILSSGASFAVVTSSNNLKDGVGILDLTIGSVIVNGETVPNNHYLVIPKADGRGITVDSDTALVLVRGDYNITG